MSAFLAPSTTTQLQGLLAETLVYILDAKNALSIARSQRKTQSERYNKNESTALPSPSLPTPVQTQILNNVDSAAIRECFQDIQRILSVAERGGGSTRDVAKQVLDVREAASLLLADLFVPLSLQHAPVANRPTPAKFGRYNLGIHRRHFWAERKLQRLGSEADSPNFALDPRKQAELYQELLRSGNYGALIHRYETQPQIRSASASYPSHTRAADLQRIQRDADCFKAYVAAMAREGKTDLLAERMLQMNVSQDGQSGGVGTDTGSNLQNIVHGFAAPSSGFSRYTQNTFTEDKNAAPVGEGRAHWMQTNVSDWERALGSKMPASASASSRAQRNASFSGSAAGRFGGGRGAPPSGPGYGPDGKNEPIQVVLSEAWSWSKFVRKLGSKLLYGILLMTGLSVILDQQGIIKSGILLFGPPGTGKTHLARAVAGEAGVPFFQMSGSEFDELYVGVGARRVRELFAAAKKKAPCIVFIDEIDAVGSKRSSKDQSYMRQTLNQLLVELDGFAGGEGVIFIAATNTPEALDKALVRPGRFDRLVPVPLPDVKGRAKILEVHMKGVSMSPDVDTHILARGTPGFSGADLANLINQAAIKASKESAKSVRMEDLEWAKDKIIMGSERKSAVITDQNKRLTAYHEGGHTLVALYSPGAMPLHKVTVIPRGNALGVTVQLPEADKTNHTKKELYAMLDVCMGGRVAEELIFGSEEVTTGAASDLEKASGVAREMVTVYGMSEKLLGVVRLGLGGVGSSPATRAVIEGEVRGLLEAAYQRANNILKTHKVELHRLAEALMEHETLSHEEVKIVIK
ncbi:ATP-dependent zinc metalloprotease FTSH 4, mitochondrial, partial [Rhizophlyctis rosea]